MPLISYHDPFNFESHNAMFNLVQHNTTNYQTRRLAERQSEVALQMIGQYHLHRRITISSTLLPVLKPYDVDVRSRKRVTAKRLAVNSSRACGCRDDDAFSSVDGYPLMVTRKRDEFPVWMRHLQDIVSCYQRRICHLILLKITNRSYEYVLLYWNIL